MTPERKELPDPDTHDTDPDAVLRGRLSAVQVGASTTGAEASTPAHTQPTHRVRTGTGTRPDPQGMRRRSLYISADASNALDAAVDQVLAALGGDVPRHVALSAVVQAGAAQADTVATELAQQRAADLAARLRSLQGSAEPPESTPGV